MLWPKFNLVQCCDRHSRGIYHFARTRSYGTTKRGAYMCEQQAIAAENRASKTEKHP
jgi:hypothetical protein